MSRILIRKGTIYDGTGRPPYMADLCIENDKISEIGQGISGTFDHTIDAGGLAVTPGFVDVHRHCDVAVLENSGFGEIELSQGITTVVSGNCGMSLAPSSDSSRENMYDFLEHCLGKINKQYQFPRF